MEKDEDFLTDVSDYIKVLLLYDQEEARKKRQVPFEQNRKKVLPGPRNVPPIHWRDWRGY